MVDRLQALIKQTPGRRVIKEEISSSDKVKLKIERHALLLRGAPTAILISAVIAIITLVVSWGKVDSSIIGLWAAAVVVFASFRLLFWYKFSRGSHSPRALLRFTQFHIGAMGVNGFIFGALAPIFAVSGMLGHAYLPFVIAGMTAAAISSASGSWKAVVAFNFPVLVSFAFSYVFYWGAEGFPIALVVSLYGLATAFLASRVQAMVERSIRLRSRNSDLLNALKQRVDIAHDAEQRFRALVEVSNDLTLIFSPEGKVTYASPSAEVVLGELPELLIGRSTKKLVHPDEFDHFRAAGSKSLSNLGFVTPLAHVCFRKCDGNYVALSGRITNMLYVPGVEGFVFSGSLVETPDTAHSSIVAVE